MRRYIVLLCILFTPVFCFAQNILRGKVIDAKTGEAIQGATIKLATKFYLSDGKGEFSIEYHSTNKPRLVINHVAFKQQTVTIDSFRYVVIKMEQFESSLSEVVVSKQADDIITKAIKNIPINYPQKSYIQDYASIMRHKMEEKERNAFFYGKINSVIRASYTGYHKNAIVPNVYLVSNQISRTVSGDNLLDTSKYIIKWYQPEVFDIVHSRSFFLNSNERKHYEFYLAEKLMWNNRLTYNIEFNHKNDQGLQGKVYIDSATYAIVYANYTRTNIRQFFFREIEKATYIVSYNLIGNKWFLDEASREANYVLRGKTTLSESYRAFKSVFVDTLNEASTKGLMLIDQWADVYTIRARNGDSAILNYKQQFESLETEVQMTPLFADSLNAQKKESGITKEINKIGKYLGSDRVGIGFILTWGQLAFAGLQNSINKNVGSASEYLIGADFSFAFYKNWAFHFRTGYNWGIGGINFDQNVIGISKKIKAQKFSLQPMLGFCRNTISDKPSGIVENSNGWVVGFSIYPKRTRLITPYFSTLFYKETYNNDAPIEIDNRNFQFSLGISFR
jgi:hypothetical protein